MPDSEEIFEEHKFAHYAMATTYEVLIAGVEKRYAGQAANACFDELDWLETLLSRFVQSSDVSRINGLKAGESTKVSWETMECLQGAKKVFESTNGAFDVTVGSLFACWRGPGNEIREPSEEELAAALARTGMQHLDLNEATMDVTVLVDGLQVDLGGIGKGYALDKMALLLDDWDVSQALLHGGGSTVLVLDAPDGKDGWPVGLGDVDIDPLSLSNTAISGSGMAVKGAHVIDPRNGKPVARRGLSWATAKSATFSDAHSTAFMVMEDSEIAKYVKSYPDIQAAFEVPSENDKSTLKWIRGSD